jgi:DNA mismatch repair protein MSH5
LNDFLDKSLILVDEFGRGTLQVDGTALFGAVIKHLLKNDEKTSLALIETHFHEAPSKKLFGFNSSPHIQFLTLILKMRVAI